MENHPSLEHFSNENITFQEHFTKEMQQLLVFAGSAASSAGSSVKTAELIHIAIERGFCGQNKPALSAQLPTRSHHPARRAAVPAEEIAKRFRCMGGHSIHALSRGEHIFRCIRLKTDRLLLHGNDINTSH